MANFSPVLIRGRLSRCESTPRLKVANDAVWVVRDALSVVSRSLPPIAAMDPLRGVVPRGADHAQRLVHLGQERFEIVRLLGGDVQAVPGVVRRRC